MKFSKLQATGNDFVLIDARLLEQDWVKLSRIMCDRHFGIGADGLLLVLKSENADFRMRIFNSDGSEAEICGNGLRCFAKYINDSGLADDQRQELLIETMAGIREVKSYGVNRFKVNMGKPRFNPDDIPVSINKVYTIPILNYPVSINGDKLLLNFVTMGNPHGICFLKEPVADFSLSELGPIVENHPFFPQRLNFEIVNVLSKNEVKVRVWERGAGETLGCGSGATAVAVIARLQGYVTSPVNVILPGGVVSVEWDGKGDAYLSGEAQLVFDGEWL